MNGNGNGGPRCLARRQGDQMHCAPCELQWDVTDAARPACNRKDRLANGDPRLTDSEIRALALGWRWLNWRQGFYRPPGGGTGDGMVPLPVFRRLEALKLMVRGNRGGIRTSYAGKAWLDRNRGPEIGSRGSGTERKKA